MSVRHDFATTQEDRRPLAGARDKESCPTKPLTASKVTHHPQLRARDILMNRASHSTGSYAKIVK